MVKAAAVGDTISGKTVTGLNFTRSGLFGDPIAFLPTFDDASQALYLSAELAARASGVARWSASANTACSGEAGFMGIGSSPIHALFGGKTAHDTRKEIAAGTIAGDSSQQS